MWAASASHRDALDLLQGKATGEETWRKIIHRCFHVAVHGELREERWYRKTFQNLKDRDLWQHWALILKPFWVKKARVVSWNKFNLRVSSLTLLFSTETSTAILQILGRMGSFSLLFDLWHIKKYQIGLQIYVTFQWLTCNKFSLSLVPFPSAYSTFNRVICIPSNKQQANQEHVLVFDSNSCSQHLEHMQGIVNMGLQI